MDVSLIRAIPTPVNVGKVHGYTKAVKGAKLTVDYRVATLSRRAKDLLAECCENEHLPAPVPNFLEINEAAESAAFILLRPVMTENEYTIPVTVTGRKVKVHLAKLIDAQKIQTVPGTRLVIPTASVSISDWGSALVLHMGALQWVPIKRRGAVAEQSVAPEDQPRQE